MPQPAPKTVANEIYESVAEYAMAGKMLPKDSSEYFSLRRKANDLLKVDRPSGLGVSGALAALAGEVVRFEGLAEQVIELPGHDIEKLYLVMFSKPLGLSALSRRLFERVDLESPVEIDRKLTMAYALFYPKTVAILRDLARRAGIREEDMRIKEADIKMQNSIIAIFGSLGLNQDNFDAIHDVAAKAAIRAGYFLTVTPTYRYDIEDDYLSVSYSLPVGLDTAFSMEDHVDDISEGNEFFPKSRVAISFHPSEEL